MIELDGTALTCDDVDAIAHRRAAARISTTGWERIGASHDWALRVSTEREVYGRSTGVGANRDQVVDDQSAHALALLRSHATSAGPLRDPVRVRGMIAVRLNQLAAGGSGTSPDLAVGLTRMLTADRLPQIQEYGSLGTGDLAALARIGLALREDSTGPDDPHDALPLLSSNAGALADAALAVVTHRQLARAYPVVAALTFDAVTGNPEAYSRAVEAVSPFPGARRLLRRMRALTAGTAPARRIQDPFGLRILPQSHGAYLDQLGALEQITAQMCNAPSENPVLLAPADGPPTIAHHGGFHAAYLGLAADAAALAMVQSAQLVLSRLASLIDPGITGLAAFLTDGTPGRSGVMLAEYVAAAALAELRTAAAPAGLQTTVISRGTEDAASFAATSTRQLLEAVEPLTTMLSVELVCAIRAVRMTGRPGPLASRVLEVATALPAGLGDRDLSPDIAAARELLPILATF